MEKVGSTQDSELDGGEESAEVLGQEVPSPLVLGGKSMMELAALTIAIADDTAS